MAVAAGRTIGYARIGTCLIYVSSKRSPSDSDWTEYAAWFQKTNPPGSTVVSVVYERNGGPNAAQRKQINEMTARCQVKAAVIAVSPIARGILTALSWFKDGYKAFNPSEMEAAFEFLDVRGALATEVRQTIQKMILEMDR